MGYAVRNDGQGWRAADSAADCAVNENYTDTPPMPIGAGARAMLQQQAVAALDATDRVAYRCFKAGVAYPVVWQTYTNALRSIVNGIDTTSARLPTQPTYPAGT